MIRISALLAIAALPALATCTGNFTYDPPIPSPAPALGGTYSVIISDTSGTNNCPWSVSSQSPGMVGFDVLSGNGSGVTHIRIGANAGGSRTLNWTVNIGPATFPQTVDQNGGFGGLAFYPLTPCRLVDTRPQYNKPAPFGPPALTAAADRTIPMAGHCGVPATAKAVSMNIAVVPTGPLGYLAAWPAGDSFPRVANLNSLDGTTIANAAVVTLGIDGALTFRAWTPYPTDMIVDINGYFDVPGATDLTLYTVTPCRAVDTRTAFRAPGPFGPPALGRLADRNFSLPQSGCGIPTTAEAFATTVFAIPQPSSSSLGYLSIWPEGLAYPNVSTLNSPTGRNMGNMAIIPAGTPNEGITVRSSDATDLLIDVNGYFAPNAGAGALHYYPIAPCRVVDTRTAYGFPGAFGAPAMSFRQTRDFPLQSGGCLLPTTVKAYVLNVAVVPLSSSLDFMNIWPAGLPRPNASTLVSPGGLTIATAAIVPAGAGTGAPISVFASNPTELIIDINGYFAP